MRGVHDLLPAEVPDVQFDFRFLIFDFGFAIDCPLLDRYPLCFGLVRVKLAIKDLVNE